MSKTPAGEQETMHLCIYSTHPPSRLLPSAAILSGALQQVEKYDLFVDSAAVNVIISDNIFRIK